MYCTDIIKVVIYIVHELKFQAVSDINHLSNKVENDSRDNHKTRVLTVYQTCRYTLIRVELITPHFLRSQLIT